MKRSAGILCPVFSLPSEYGVGTLGQAAKDFVDVLKAAHQSYWQILPIGCTSYGDSPYQSFSAYAGNPYWIDLDELCKEGFLYEEEYKTLDWGKDPRKVDYALLYKNRFQVLRKACTRLTERQNEAFESFCQKEAHWLDDFALFMTLKVKHGGVSFHQWDEPYRLRWPQALKQAEEEYKEDIAFWKGTQYFFFDQYFKLKKYANENGISIIGDIPIYIALDSVDVWSRPKYFQLDEDRKPTHVAGCPPDLYSETGQLWGNPLFDWDVIKQEGYQWWIDRIAHQLRFADVLRIDHFRGFAGYYSIPADREDAIVGTWEKGPGIELFNAVKEKLGDVSIIAEDLGYLTPDVIQMVKDTGYPGMKILQFAFNSRETNTGYMPHSHIRNCVVYTGTHDNETILEWVENSLPEDLALAEDYMHLTKEEGYNWGMIRTCLSSVADLAVVPLADYLDEAQRGRINVPGTPSDNWVWRFTKEDLNEQRIQKIRHLTMLYQR